MTRRKLLFLSLLAAVPVACLSTVAGCRSAGPCGWIAAGGDFWWPAAYVPPLVVGVASVLVWALRLGLIASSASVELGTLRRIPVSLELVRGTRAAGIDRIVCVEGESPVAFCAGFVRPTVFISEGALAELSESELLAVLHHEADHARRREPLRRAASVAAAEALSFLPIVRWWTDRQLTRTELRADIAAEQMVGRPALAGALLVMTAPATSLAVFVGHTEL